MTIDDFKRIFPNLSEQFFEPNEKIIRTIIGETRFEMPSEIRDQWLTDLRSGQYTQGHHNLRGRLNKTTTSAYCCLGVLCDQYAHVDPYGTNPEWEFHVDTWYLLGDSVYLAYKIREWAFVGNIPKADTESFIDILGRINDSMEVTFPEIANFIEASTVGV